MSFAAIPDPHVEEIEIVVGEASPGGKHEWRSTADPMRRGLLADADFPGILYPSRRLRVAATGTRFATDVHPLPRRAQPPTEHGRHAGDVVIVWVPFSGMPGPRDLDKAGKKRPAVIVGSTGDALLVRAIYDGKHSMKRRAGAPLVRDWVQAGLRKASVVDTHVMEVDPADVEGPVGHLSDHDAGRLEIWRHA